MIININVRLLFTTFKNAGRVGKEASINDDRSKGVEECVTECSSRGRGCLGQ